MGTKRSQIIDRFEAQTEEGTRKMRIVVTQIFEHRKGIDGSDRWVPIGTKIYQTEYGDFCRKLKEDKFKVLDPVGHYIVKRLKRRGRYPP
jgi:hypothetical protein